MSSPKLARRQFLSTLAALGLLPTLGSSWASTSPTPPLEIATAWDDSAGRHFVGVLQVNATAAWIATSIEVPTRAHGLTYLPDGSILAAARRSGEWLLRWQPRTQVAQWHWLEGDYRLSGHALAVPEQHLLYCTETDTSDDSGWLCQRDLASLQVQQRWPTCGRDPHDLKPWGSHHVLIANGGIATQPETGRAKLDVQRMDSSLVLLNLHSGATEQQWRLPDPFLSIRHLSVHPTGLVGAALQAQKVPQAAPLLAVFNIQEASFTLGASGGSAHGYGADISALAQGWVVSCPKDDVALLYDLEGKTMQRQPLAGACALATTNAGTWLLGKEQLLALGTFESLRLPTGLQADNHAVLRAPPLP